MAPGRSAPLGNYPGAAALINGFTVINIKAELCQAFCQIQSFSWEWRNPDPVRRAGVHSTSPCGFCSAIPTNNIRSV